MDTNTLTILNQLEQLKSEKTLFLDKLKPIFWELEENDQAEFIPRLREIEAAERNALNHLLQLVENYALTHAAGQETQRIEPIKLDEWS